MTFVVAVTATSVLTASGLAVGGTLKVLSSVFENLRRSLDEMLARATRPEDRRLIMARMKGTLVQARLGVDDLKDALAQTRRKLEHEQKELETVRRRKTLAQGINDAETVAIAERFEAQIDEKVRIFTEKVAVQEREVAVAERELEEMKAELRNAMTSGPMAGAASTLEDPLADEDGSRAAEEIDSLARERARTDRAAEAERRLEELKKKMGK